MNATLFRRRWYKGLGQVNAAQSYPMDVVIGVWPGGDFKAWLLIEKDGINYDKDSKGAILSSRFSNWRRAKLPAVERKCPFLQKAVRFGKRNSRKKLLND